MIGSFTYETVGFNPTALIIVLSAVTVISLSLLAIGRLNDKLGNYNAEDNLYMSAGIVAVLGALLGSIIPVAVEQTRMANVNEYNYITAANQEFESLGYEDLTLNEDNWSASLDGKYVKGSLEYIENNTYEIYQYESK